MTREPEENETDRRFRLTGYGDTKTDAYIRIREFDRAGRIKRALAGLATWWAVALGCILIPVAHFVLVPGFTIFGLFTFAQRLRTPALVVAAHGTCPDCGAEQDLDMLGPWREGQDVSCRKCQRSLQLSAPSGAGDT